MCEGCLDLLNSCITFREMCQMSSRNMIEFEEVNVKIKGKACIFNGIPVAILM